jgi:[glutamine synthetase] adenylyltransferase / [glutamine synthetase]-adenylyl-L-tyrosine phosphorylase
MQSDPMTPCTDEGTEAGVATILARARERLEQVGASLATDLERVVVASEFVLDALVADPALRANPWVLDAAPFEAVHDDMDEAAVMSAMRHARRRALARIAVRDIAERASTEQTLVALSALADAAIQTAVAHAERLVAPRFGHPHYSDGRRMPLVVIGMGKLGGGELNFSSDIDLVFLYPEGGETDGRRPADHFEYYTRLGQKVIHLLDAPTVDGFVYRVDMRLRPFGDSGPLASSFAALEDYLQHHGRDWERYAWVKARAVTGADAYADAFDSIVRPFVYRRYLDFGVFESLREMKGMIQREVERRELSDHIKLGRGGIREVEFVVQALQLVRGGGDPRLRTPSLLSLLPRLAGQKLLPDGAVAELREAYLHLRRVENRLQMVADEQTHSLPTDALRQKRIVVGLNLSGWAALLTDLNAQRDRVSACFAALVLAGTSDATPQRSAFEGLYAAGGDAAALADTLTGVAEHERADMAARLVALRASGYYRRLGEVGRNRLHGLLARVVIALQGHSAADTVLRRTLSVIEAIGARTAYLALLNENPLALSRLIDVCGLGNFLSAQIAAHPLLLDELIDPGLFDHAPSRAQVGEELALRLEDCVDDTERAISAMRDVQRAAIFRIALYDLTGRLPLMQVSDRLTDVAELILARAMEHAWWDMLAVYGAPMAGSANGLRVCKIAAIGYGKLGGRELGYGSDLDLVFVHDSAGEVQETAGPKVIDNQVFFLRLGQKILHLLTFHSAAGRLYDVDTRLRPSGKGGLLMTQIDAFVRYQRTEAWTWEHQALLHSRAVAGSAELMQAFEAARLDVLTQAVRREQLRTDIRDMRERMRRELSRAGASEFDLKQDRGGLADIEFLAQYWVLKHAQDYPPLVTFPDTIRMLESVGSAALVNHGVIDRLIDTYRDYRAVLHRRSLEGCTRVVPTADHAADAAWVGAVWEAVMVRDAEPSHDGPSV